MSIDTLVTYILVWPVISAGVLLLLVVSLIRDLRAAKREGREML